VAGELLRGGQVVPVLEDVADEGAAEVVRRGRRGM
jgi:hypothetical protein